MFYDIIHILLLVETESLTIVHLGSGSNSLLRWAETGVHEEHVVPVSLKRRRDKLVVSFVVLRLYNKNPYFTSVIVTAHISISINPNIKFIGQMLFYIVYYILYSCNSIHIAHIFTWLHYKAKNINSQLFMLIFV